MKLKAVLIAVVLAIAMIAVVMPPMAAYTVQTEELKGAPDAAFFERAGFIWQINENQAIALPRDIYLSTQLKDGQSKEDQSDLRMKQFFWSFYTRNGYEPESFFFVPVIEGKLPFGTDAIPVS